MARKTLFTVTWPDINEGSLKRKFSDAWQVHYGWLTTKVKDADFWQTVPPWAHSMSPPLGVLKGNVIVFAEPGALTVNDVKVSKAFFAGRRGLIEKYAPKHLKGRVLLAYDRMVEFINEEQRNQ